MSWTDRRYDNSPYFREYDRPYATYWLIGISAAAAVMVWGFSGGASSPGFGAIVDHLGVSGYGLARAQVWRLISYIFLHGSVGHLFWNMVMLVFAAGFLERAYGPRRIVTMYLGFGAVAGLAVLWNLVNATAFDDTTPTIGASGACLGLVAFLGCRFPKQKFYIWGVVPLEGWALAALLAGLDVLSLIANESGNNTAHGVHLLGMAAGVGYGLLYPWSVSYMERRRRIVERKRVERRREKDEDEHLELDRVLEKINQGGGLSSLSERERRFLLDQSEKLKSKGRT
jgi:membrane associated rhomboid family serine protease